MIIKKKIINLINKKKEGITLDNFINICLYGKNGYYNNIDPIGKEGDFITAPEISQLFGEIIGLYFYNKWILNFKNKINIIELGPGKGTLLLDILNITKNFTKFHQNLNITLIEKNKKLIKIQKQNILNSKFNNLSIKWINNFTVSNSKPVFILANEFFDCLPIKQFFKKNNKWFEKAINYNNKEKIFLYENLEITDKSLLKKLLLYKKNFVEISLEREKYFIEICKIIKKNLGILILVDYGYYHRPESSTIQSVYKNKNSNLLDNLGSQDITSLVDFKKFIEISKYYNLTIESFCDQKSFLIKNGIIERKNIIIKNSNKKYKETIEQGYKRLVNEKAMGSIFKFLIISNNNFNEKKNK